MTNPKNVPTVARHVGPAAAALWISLAVCAPAFALDPSLDISQYAHTAWKIRDGFVSGTITSLAQTRDGYLWIGTDAGVFRFDGIRAVPWRPPGIDSSRVIRGYRLLAARDGALWISTDSAILRWKDGKLSEYSTAPGTQFGALFEDREGRIWVGSLLPAPARICRVATTTLECSDGGAALGVGIDGLIEDSNGSLWAGLQTGLARWRPEPVQLFPLPPILSPYKVVEDDGALLVGTADGLARFAGGKTELVHPSPTAVRPLPASALLRDRDGGLWMGTSGRGLAHFGTAGTSAFGEAEGLTGNTVAALLEDREGTIWVATGNGLDRFRNIASPGLSIRDGLSSQAVTATLAATDGSLWIGTIDGVNRWHRGEMTTYRNLPRPALPGVRQVVSAGFPERSHALFQDSAGRVWLSDRNGAGYMAGDRFVPIPGVSGEFVYAIVENPPGDIWVVTIEELIRVRNDRVVAHLPWSELRGPARLATIAALAEPGRGGLWLGFFEGGLARFVDGRFERSVSAADGLGRGMVRHIRRDDAGTIWASTEGGLSRVADRRIATLDSSAGLPCDTVHWSVADVTGSVWLFMPCGLLRVPAAEMQAWASSVDRNEPRRHRVQFSVFDNTDGIRLLARPPGAYSPQVSMGADGRLWFTTLDRVNVIDPRKLWVNTTAPPVHVEHVVADRQRYEPVSGLALPALTRDLQIDYTALSLVAPEKNRFRIKLEGWDRDWQDVGTRRQAFYNNLPPGRYVFRVAASNNSGVWNDAGATLAFSLAAAYYQTAWFRATVVIGTLAALWALYQRRVRQLAREYDVRLEARVAERTRIARELHDTLLQSFLGVTFRFQAARNLLPHRQAEAISTLDSALDQTGQALKDSREAIQGLRSGASVQIDLADAIAVLGHELGANASTAVTPALDIGVEGQVRGLHPVVRDDIYRIVSEALRNAFTHARARRIDVIIRYDADAFQVVVADDGIGIGPDAFKKHAEGHWGLPGMRERAELIGGTLELLSRGGAGSRIELTVPGRLAYAAAPRQGSFWRRRASRSAT